MSLFKVWPLNLTTTLLSINFVYKSIDRKCHNFVVFIDKSFRLSTISF